MTTSSTSSGRNAVNKPMELVDRYLQAVRFWLPNTHKQDDLIAELGEDLRSQIEDKEAELGHPLDAAGISEILKRCGMPMVVAGRLGPKRFLIGPTLYPVYAFVMKMVLLWILVPVFVFIIGPVNFANNGHDWGSAIGTTLGNLWAGLFIAGGIVTLVFVVLERTQAHVGGPMTCANWDPLKLPPVRKQARKTSLAQTVCELAFGVIGIMWLLLIPRYPVLILGPAAAFLKAAPLWHTVYVPILLLGLLGLLRAGIILARPQFTWFPPLGELVQGALTLILVNFLVHAAGQTPNGDWHPFVMVTDAARHSAQYVKAAAIVNVSIMLSLAGAWLGLSIALAINVWKLLRSFRKPSSSAGEPASLHA